MFKITTIVVGMLSVCHFCLAIDSSGEGQGGAEQELQMQSSQDSVDHAVVPRKMRFVTVDAAMSVNKGGSIYLRLLIGKRVYILIDGIFRSEMSTAMFNLPDDMHIQAAFVTLDSPNKRIFYGDKYGSFYAVGGPENKRIKYGPARAFIRDGGPDAAGRKSGKVYVFKGCQVAFRNSWNDWGKPVNVTTIDLPCDVHAAWKENDVMVILKGDRIWRWSADGTVTGPEPFESTYKLKNGYALLPVKEEPPKQTAVDYNDSP